ncbi:hypothetical protein [Chroococcidiopsis sp. CCMEE 29]|uniref:hypothetical protein n=1 Tax=Chroococcidiopsis sp. CCMEE 29 TaxID=155894 RepID=UPI002021BC4D|nr:hypothetical protein [Chroococcidiopsis sp. CCMEE 29]
MSNFKKAIRAARKFLKHQSPAWLNVEINRDFFENFTAAIAPAPNLLPPVSDSPLRGQPHWRRIAQVYEILDRATKDGMVSYTALVNYVREVTGKGCSRKLISKWKLERGFR